MMHVPAQSTPIFDKCPSMCRRDWVTGSVGKFGADPLQTLVQVLIDDLEMIINGNMPGNRRHSMVDLSQGGLASGCMHDFCVESLRAPV